MKASNPVAKARNIYDEPAFKWWVPYTQKKRDRIIAAINSCVQKSTHKYGIEVPTSVEYAKCLDEKNGNTMWQDAMKKEMYNVSIAFKIIDSGEKRPPGWAPSSGHIVLDVKMDFTRKA